MDTNASFLKDFQNRAVLLNRGLNKARLNILQHKQELDHLLEKDLNTIQKSNDRATEDSQILLQNITNQTDQQIETMELFNGDEEIEAQHNTTRLQKRKAELELSLPYAKSTVPELRQKVRSSKLAHAVNVRHLYFQQHELQKMHHVSQVAAKYAQSFVNSPKEALTLSRDIARTGLDAMKAPANRARQASIKMIENELTVLSNLRSSLAKDEAIIAKGMSLKTVVEKMHAMLEKKIPSLTLSRTSRLAMFHECTGRGGSTLTSGESACKELLVLHTPVLFQKHLNAVVQMEQEVLQREQHVVDSSSSRSSNTNDAIGAVVATKEAGPEILAVEEEMTAMDKNDAMQHAAAAHTAEQVAAAAAETAAAETAQLSRFARIKTMDATTVVHKMLLAVKKGDETVLKSEIEKEEQQEEMQENKDHQEHDANNVQLANSLKVASETARELPGSVMSELSKVAEELKKEDPQGEKAAVEEEEKMKNIGIQGAQDLMSAAKAPMETDAMDALP